MTTLLEQISPGGIPESVTAARADVLRAAARCYEVLLDEGNEVFTVAERAGLALLTAWRTGDPRLSAWFVDVLRDHGVAAGDVRSLTAALPRLAGHVDLVTTLVEDAGRADAATLREAGGTPRATVVVAQVVGYVSYLSRLLDGLAALNRGEV
jgi:uncharacterized protein YciW